MAQGLLEKIVNVRKQEWRLLSWLLLFFFFESIGTEIMDILAVSTFLKEAGIRNLPLVYIFDEVLLALFLVAYGTVVDRFDRAKFVNYLQIGFAAALVMLFAAIKAGASPMVISVLIYVLKSLIISVLEEAFWLMNDDLYDVQEAKRLYPIINLGGVAGGMVGGGLVAALLTTVVEDTNNLIPIAPADAGGRGGLYPPGPQAGAEGGTGGRSGSHRRTGGRHSADKTEEEKEEGAVARGDPLYQGDPTVQVHPDHLRADGGGGPAG